MCVGHLCHWTYAYTLRAEHPLLTFAKFRNFITPFYPLIFCKTLKYAIFFLKTPQSGRHKWNPLLATQQRMTDPGQRERPNLKSLWAPSAKLAFGNTRFLGRKDKEGLALGNVRLIFLVVSTYQRLVEVEVRM